MGQGEGSEFVGSRSPRIDRPEVDDRLDEIFTWPAEEWQGRRRVEVSDAQLDEIFGARPPRGRSGEDGDTTDSCSDADSCPDFDRDADADADADAGSDAARDAELSGPVRALMVAVAVVGAQAPAELPGRQAMTEAEVLLAQLEQLRAVVLARVADVDRRQLHELAGALSTGRWMAGQQSSLTRTDLAFARRLAVFPAVAQAVEAGRLSVTVAARVTAALVKARRHLDRPDGLIDEQPGEATIRAVVLDGVLSLLTQGCGGLPEGDRRVGRWHEQLRVIADSPTGQLDRLTQAVLLLAEQLTPADLPGALGQLLDALLPGELERRGRDGHDQRGFRMRRKHDGSGWLISRGGLDLECGELLHTVLTAELTTDPDHPTDTDGYASARQDGWQPDLDDELPAASAGGPRTLDQRRHDALKHGLRRYLDAGIAGLRDKVAPHLNVTVTLDTLHNSPGAPAPVAASGARLPRDLVRSWWCNSQITRFVLSLGHRVIETSHTDRTLKPHERRAKKLETGGQCQAATCSRGPATGQRLIPHHPDAWATTGTTSYTNTVLFCEHDHHQLHQGHPLRLKDGRRLGADGWLTSDHTAA